MGVPSWDQEFRQARSASIWQTNGTGTIGQQNGMLTIQAASDSAPSRSGRTMCGAAATTGRWDARVRAFERSTTGTPYRFTWELVPLSGNDSRGQELGSCSGSDISWCQAGRGLGQYLSGQHVR